MWLNVILLSEFKLPVFLYDTYYGIAFLEVPNIIFQSIDE